MVSRLRPPSLYGGQLSSRLPPPAKPLMHAGRWRHAATAPVDDDADAYTLVLCAITGRATTEAHARRIRAQHPLPAAPHTDPQQQLDVASGAAARLGGRRCDCFHSAATRTFAPELNHWILVDDDGRGGQWGAALDCQPAGGGRRGVPHPRLCLEHRIDAQQPVQHTLRPLHLRPLHLRPSKWSTSKRRAWSR